MASSSSAFKTPTEQFALLAALHSSEVELENARTSLVSTFPAESRDVEHLQLRLLLVQHKIARCTRETPDQVPALLKTQEDLLAKFHSATGGGPDHFTFATRAKLLEASVSKEKRSALFKEVVSSLPLSAQTGFQGSSGVGVGTGCCPAGHMLNTFQTPRARFGKSFA
jgi:hypothetical protein